MPLEHLTTGKREGETERERERQRERQESKKQKTQLVSTDRIRGRAACNNDSKIQTVKDRHDILCAFLLINCAKSK